MVPCGVITQFKVLLSRSKLYRKEQISTATGDARVLPVQWQMWWLKRPEHWMSMAEMTATQEDAECKWVLLTLALDQGSSVFPILFLSCLFHLPCFKHPLAVFVGQGSNVQKLVKYSFVNSLSCSCCFGEQSFPSIINLRPWADQRLHPSTERKSWLLSHISNRKHHLTF